MKIAHRKTQRAQPPRAARAVAPRRARAPDSSFGASAEHGTVELTARAAPPAQARVTARVLRTLFDGWLKVKEVELTVTRGGVETQTMKVKALVRPGHDSTHVLTMRLHGDAPPTLVYKEGDTRPAAALRGTPYVSTGIVAGSLDHPGEDAEVTALLEIAEEVGGTPLGRLVALGEPAATMDVVDGEGDTASTEFDSYHLAVVSDERGTVEGDGGGLEVAALMGPVDVSVAEAVKRLDEGGVRENARARVALSRGLDKAGFLPSLDLWVRQLPPALRQRFDTLGLDEVWDARSATVPVRPPAEPAAPKPSKPLPPAINMELAAKIDGVDLGTPTALPLERDAAMLTTKIWHLAHDVRVGREIPVNTLHVDYDRLKLAQYWVDPKKGPMVRLDDVERPMLAAKAALKDAPAAMATRDVMDLRVQLPQVQIDNGAVVGAQGLEETARARALEVARAALPGAKLEVLSAPSYASPGQSDLSYHFMAARVDPREGGTFVPLADAVRAVRAQGQGDANTEALLLRLADRLGWVPELGMSRAEAARLVKAAARG